MNRAARWLAFCLGGWLVVADAAEPLSYTWVTGSFNVSTGDLTLTAPTPGDWEGAFAEAAARWTDATIVTVTTDGNPQAADCRDRGPSTAFFQDTFCGTAWGSTTLATAFTRFFIDPTGAGRATHTDIVFNSTKNWTIDDGSTFHSAVDFTRVAVHELGHSIGLGHTPDSTAIMYALVGGTIAPQTDDVYGTNRFYGAEVDQVLALDDFSGNGWQELGVVLVDDDGRHLLHVRDGRNDTKLRQLNLGSRPLISLSAAPDASGNGAQEVVTLARLRSGAYRLRLVDVATKAVVAQRQLAAGVRWVDAVVIPDTDGGGQPDVVVAGLNADDKIRALVIDGATGANVRSLNFGGADELVQLLALPDLDGDALPEVAALVSNASNVGVVRIRNAATGATVRNLSFGSFYRPLAIAMGRDVDANGFPELLQLGQGESGQIRVMRRDLGPGGASTKTFLNATNRPVGIVGLGDSNGDGVPDYGAVIERDSEDPRLRMIDGATGKTFRSVFFDGIGNAQEALTVADQNGSGRREIVVLGNQVGTYRTQTRDSKSGNELNTITYR